MAILASGTTWADGTQASSTNLNAAVNSATFASGAVDDSTTALSGGAIIVKDGGITAAKLSTGAPSWDGSGNTTVSGTITGASTVSDSKGDVRDIPQSAKTSAHTLVIGDAGKSISITTGGVTVPNSVFSAGDVVVIYNDSASNQTITQGSGVTLRLGGTTTTGNRTLAGRGICTIYFNGASEAIALGAGIT